MVSLTLRLTGARIFCFRRFCQALIHIAPQSPQIAREGLQKFGSGRTGRHSPELAKPVGQLAPGPGQALPERCRDRLGDVAAMKADLLAQEVACPRFRLDLARQSLELSGARDKL